MRTVRRLYFYFVAFISLEVIIWGVVSLARTLFEILPGGGATNQIATGLSLVLVGVPIFLLHWVVVQRDAQKDEEERTSRLRGIFLYGVRLAVLIPVVQNVLAIVSRLMFTLLGKPVSMAYVGATQSIWDNLVAIAVNLVAWWYFEQVLNRDWAANLPGSELPEVRRLQRYIWVLYGLGIAVFGVEQILYYIFYTPGGLNAVELGWLGNGLAWALVGAPLWVYTWQIVQRSLDQPGERLSTLRLVVLYLLALAGVVVTLSAAGVVIGYSIRWVLGEPHTLADFLSEHSTALSIGITFGAIWAYYGKQLQLEITFEEDIFRKAGMRRLYAYILALLGNATAFFGLWWLVGTLVDLAFGHLTGPNYLRNQISIALAALVVGLPVWLRNWPPMQVEAALTSDLGDHARRSLVRKGYLYLVLFLTVAGVMVSAGMLFFLVLNTLLGTSQYDFWLNFFQRLQSLLLVLLWLGYHFSALREDGRRAQHALTERHLRFGVVVFDDEAGSFSAELLPALQLQAPRLPVAVVRLGKDPLEESLDTARAVVISARLLAEPPEALHLWLSQNHSQRVVVPLPEPGWVWLGAAQRSQRDLAKETAQAVRQLAEGQPVKPPTSSNAWVITGYVLAALFALEIGLVLFGSVMSMIGN
jgi:hypothetical protein